MELRCPHCDVAFIRTDAAPGDALMCPRCRSLVAAGAPEPPLPAMPVPAKVPARAAAQAAGPGASPRWAGSGAREQVALVRTCPGCAARYDVDRARCPSCGKHVHEARWARDGAEVARKGRILETFNLGLYAVGGIVILALGGLSLHGEDAMYVLYGAAAVLLLVWRLVAWLRARRVRRSKP